MVKKQVQSKKKVPGWLQAILWSADVADLDLEKNKSYIIHQILIYGTIKEILWLLRTYSKKEVVKVFLTPCKNYPRPTFYFVKNHLLNLKNRKLSEDAYVTSIHGPVKPRASTGF